MKVRPIETRLEVPVIERRPGLNPDSSEAPYLCEIEGGATLYGWDDADESRAEFIKSIKAAHPVPWRHGGLNE